MQEESAWVYFAGKPAIYHNRISLWFGSGLYGRIWSVILTAQFHFISIQRISAPDLLTGIFQDD